MSIPTQGRPMTAPVTQADREPCPFCGGEADGYDTSQNAIMCYQCMSAGPESEIEAVAIAAWNTRASTEALEARVKVLEGVLGEAREGLTAMMNAWFDYHDANSLTEPVTGAAGAAFDRALAAREECDKALETDNEQG